MPNPSVCTVLVTPSSVTSTAWNGVEVPVITTPSDASTWLITSSPSMGSGLIVRRPASVSNTTFRVSVAVLPARSVELAVRTTVCSPEGSSFAENVTVQLPFASTLALRDAPLPSATDTEAPGSVVPVTVMPCIASSAFTMPSAPPAWLVMSKLRTHVSRTTCPVALLVLPTSSVAVALIVRFCSPTGISVAVKVTDQLPCASTKAVRV